MKYNASSLEKLKRVHPALVSVVMRAQELAKGTEFDGKIQPLITEGPRTLERQKKLVAAGASKTLNSRHIPGKDGYAKAVDFAFSVGGKLRWDWPPFTAWSKIMKQASKDTKVPIEWGGDWKSFKDGPHYQLPHSKYP